MKVIDDRRSEGEDDYKKHINKKKETLALCP